MRKIALAAARCTWSIRHAANVGFAAVYNQRPKQTTARFSRAEQSRPTAAAEFLLLFFDEN
jgi:hypothetical protein